MKNVIVVTSGKGGTGKTTVCAGLAAAIARTGKRVLIIDCDSGMRGIDMMLGISDKLVYDISDIISGGCEYNEALYKADSELQLYCVAAPLYADDEVSPSLVREFVEKAKNDFDWIPPVPDRDSSRRHRLPIWRSWSSTPSRSVFADVRISARSWRICVSITAGW